MGLPRVPFWHCCHRWQETGDVYPAETRVAKGFNQAFKSAPGPEPQNNNQGSLPDLKVTDASGFYPLVALSAEPWLAKDSLFQGLLETYVHPCGVGPSSTVNHPQLSTQRPPTSVTIPSSSMTSFTDNQDPLHPVCLLTVSQMLQTYSTHQTAGCLPTEPTLTTFFSPTKSLHDSHLPKR